MPSSWARWAPSRKPPTTGPNTSSTIPPSCRATEMSESLLQVRDLTLEYKTPQRRVRATHEVSFEVLVGYRYILLGAFGCGKFSLLKASAGGVAPTSGQIHLGGNPL